MLGLPVGLIALVIVTILILSGVAQRVLDRMKMNDRTALMLVLAMLVGGFLPDLPLAPTLSINVGGGLIPIGISLYLFVTAGTAKERWRTVLATIATTSAIYLVSAYLPTEKHMLLDPIYMFALIAGITAYLLGRSRRGCARLGGRRSGRQVLYHSGCPDGRRGVSYRACGVRGGHVSNS
ncbi:MAG: hypothetical protein DDT39_01595 [Firmicutes bacterium]|nr:hypothetical protein [candidate division NPL-UPA2 bacterium]MBT9154909.1 hypothetical protein [candidate division NPL-UPA2 bacterium]